MTHRASFLLSLCLAIPLTGIPGSTASAQDTTIPQLVTPHRQTESFAERTLSYDITANVPYDAVSDVPWVTVKPREGGVYVILAENPTFDSREAHITFSNAELGITQTLTLQQGGNENELVRYFRTAIANYGAADYTGGEPLTAETIAQARDSIWSAWRLANTTTKEQKLIELTTLSANTKGSWTIPSGWPEAGQSMAYYYGSRGTKPAAGYPLFLYIHGSGDPDGEFATSLNFSLNMDTAPSVHFAPRIPQTGQWYRWYQQSKQWAWEQLLRQVMVSGVIDPDRLYILGISEGGYGGQRLASFYADYWAAAGPMAGGEPLKNAPAENLRNTAFSLRTGSLDTDFSRNILTGYTRDALDSLRALHPDGYVHWVNLEEGRGHGIDYYTTPVWLKKYTRNARPLKVTWEDYDMDGRRRKGFHNLEVLEVPNPNYRTRYDEVIEDNTVTITVQSLDYTTTETIEGIETRFERTYFTPRVGSFRVYLNEDMVDFTAPVRIIVNGKEKFNGLLQPDVRHMANSTRLFFDPRRIFPAAVDVSLN